MIQLNEITFDATRVRANNNRHATLTAAGIEARSRPSWGDGHHARGPNIQAFADSQIDLISPLPEAQANPMNPAARPDPTVPVPEPKPGHSMRRRGLNRRNRSNTKGTCIPEKVI